MNLVVMLGVLSMTVGQECQHCGLGPQSFMYHTADAQLETRVIK